MNKYNKQEAQYEYGQNTIVHIRAAGTNHEFAVFNKIHDRELIEEDISEELKATYDERFEVIKASLDTIRIPAEDIFGPENVTLQVSGIAPTNRWFFIRQNNTADDFELNTHVIKVRILIPTIDIVNEYEASHTLKDLGIEVKFESVSKHHARVVGLSGIRFSLSLRERGHNYMHSHLPSINADFVGFCLGRTDLSAKMGAVIPARDIDMLFGLVLSLAGTESISGSPYRRLDSVIDVTNSLRTITSGGNAPYPDSIHTAQTIINAIRAGEIFPLTIDQSSPILPEIRLENEPIEFLQDIADKYAPEVLRVTSTSNTFTEANIRNSIGATHDLELRTRAKVQFGDTKFDKITIAADKEELEVLKPTADKEELILTSFTRTLLASNMITMINNRLKNESRWTVQAEV